MFLEPPQVVVVGPVFWALVYEFQPVGLLRKGFFGDLFQLADIAESGNCKGVVCHCVVVHTNTLIGPAFASLEIFIGRLKSISAPYFFEILAISSLSVDTTIVLKHFDFRAALIT